MSPETTRKDYISRINKVIDYIDKHLNDDLTLKKLSDVANFSEYHFHRVFSSIVREPLYKFIRRIRLERAADILINHPDKSIFDVACETGFNGPSQFSRAFNEYFGISPSEWQSKLFDNRNSNNPENSKNRKMIDKDCKYLVNSDDYICDVIFTDYIKNWRIKMNGQSGLTAKVEVKDMPEMTVAYIRHIGPYAGDDKLFGMLFGKLMGWAGPKGLIRFPQTKMISIYHDNPEITDEEKLRISVCLTVPPDTKVDGEIGKMIIPAGKYAIAYFEIDVSQYGAAWDAVFAGWLPQSGYKCVDGYCYENYLNDPANHPEGKHIVEICIPVEPN